MPVHHKFLNFNLWGNGFETQSAILHTPYRPKTIIIGTFNHGWPWNNADFFYGRGMYMWTVMANLFLYNANILVDRRNPPPGNNIPPLNQIFEICTKGQFCFADVVLGINPAIPVAVNVNNKCVGVNNGAYVWTGYKDSCLNHMGINGWLDDNVQNIIRFINDTPSIEHIYFTFATGGAWLVGLKNLIMAEFQHLDTGSIYTPTGMRLPNYIGFPHRPFSLAHHWVWNNQNHLQAPIANPNYVNLSHDWLINCGVNPNNF